jgi:outer membrane protein
MLKTMNKILITGMVCLAIFSANGQALDLATCLKMADTANLTIRNARLDVSLNNSQRKTYLTAKLPHVAFNADYKYNALIPGQVVPASIVGGPAGAFTTVQFGVPFVFSNNLQLTQVLFNPQINYGLTVLKINDEIVKIQQRITEQDIKHQVASTFFNLQAITKQLEFIQANMQNIEKIIANMKLMVKQQLMLQTEVDKLDINRLTLVNSQASLNATKFQLESLLKILIGLDQSATITANPGSMVEKTILVDKSVVNYPELELVETQQRMNTAERKGTNMAYLPNLTFYAAYSYTYNMKPEDNYRKGIQGSSLGIKLDWTLFDGMEKMKKQREIKLKADKLSNQKELYEQQLKLKTANYSNQITVQANALEVAKEQLHLAEKVYKQTAAQFSEGTINSTELIIADTAMQQAQTTVITAYIQLRQAELDYMKSIGNIN